MQQFIVQASERGQRFDKYLRRRLPLAPSSFIYKMLRKKNITLRGKKAGGNETVEEGDVVALFLSDETIRKFSADVGGEKDRRSAEEADRAYAVLTPLLGKKPVLYEDDQILLIAKPPGILSQKAGPSDLSANEWLRGYLRKEQKDKKEGGKGWSGEPRTDAAQDIRVSGIDGKDRSAEPRTDAAQDIKLPGIEGKDRSAEPRTDAAQDIKLPDIKGKDCRGKREEALLFTPSVCNRLDRNTGGILLCAKTLQGSRMLSEMIRDRRIKKTYRMLVHGRITEPGRIEGDLVKDREQNQVYLPGTEADRSRLQATKARHAVTVYRPVRTGKETTLVEADLITGRSHQLRVHMASIGHPIVGDPRYGSRPLDRALGKKTGSRQIRAQLLWCTAVTFPEKTQEQGNAYPAGKTFRCPEPDWWRRLEV